MHAIKPFFQWPENQIPDGEAMLKHITEAGRIAYQSEKQGDEEAFVRGLIRRGHESVLEHEKISVILTCDRGVTHEIVRHRLASYTQESTRYCNYSGEKYGSEVGFIDIRSGIKLDQKMQGLSTNKIVRIIDEWIKACEDSERHYMKMIELGATPQIARSVLNNSLKTQIYITMNLREWRHFFKLRAAPDAHPQMREVAEMLLEVFREVVPVVFEEV